MAFTSVTICPGTSGTLREVALRVGITERAVIAIVHDLADTKVLTVSRQGRRNVYRIHQQAHLRHPVEQHKTVGDLIRAILDWAGSPVRN